jgi:excisionase family DNA binding protein
MKNIDELRAKVIRDREWMAQAARDDNAAGGGLYCEYDYDGLLEDVQDVGLTALKFGRADVYEVCSGHTFLGHSEAAVLMDRVAKMLEEPETPEPDFLSIKQAAALSGLSPTKVRRDVVAGRLPAANKGSKRRPLCRIAKDELETWMRQEGAAKVPPKSELVTLVDRYFSASRTAR